MFLFPGRFRQRFNLLDPVRRPEFFEWKIIEECPSDDDDRAGFVPYVLRRKCYTELTVQQSTQRSYVALEPICNEFPLQKMIQSGVAYQIFSLSFLIRVLSVVGLIPNSSAAPPRP